MIDLYTWTTPNGRKVSILLEELGVEYKAHTINIGQDEQFSPEFLKVAPNNKIPAIVDHDNGMNLMESGAILLYLANKYDRFQCKGDEYWRMMEWLMWQKSGFGPMLGQTHHFLKYNSGISEYAENRFSNETKRLYKVLNERMQDRDYVAGEGRGEYSIADMAIWPWASRFEWQQIDLSEFPNVKGWYEQIALRPAVQTGYQVPKYMGEIPMP